VHEQGRQGPEVEAPVTDPNLTASKRSQSLRALVADITPQTSSLSTPNDLHQSNILASAARSRSTPTRLLCCTMQLPRCGTSTSRLPPSTPRSTSFLYPQSGFHSGYVMKRISLNTRIIPVQNRLPIALQSRQRLLLLSSKSTTGRIPTHGS
jgi:hypothetical protein